MPALTIEEVVAARHRNRKNEIVSDKIILEGFKTKEQALEFLNWYEGGGEQQFYDHLNIVGKDPDDGCNIDVKRKGNTGRYYDVLENGYVAQVK